MNTYINFNISGFKKLQFLLTPLALQTPVGSGVLNHVIPSLRSCE